jgi:two-component system cell cycle response regulator
MTERMRVLLVEDNPADARWVREVLAEDGAAEFVIEQAATVQEAVGHLATHQTGVDAVLLDLSLPDDTGVNTVRRVAAATQTAVIIVMTGHGDEQVGIAALQAGAQDYLVKGQVDGRTVRRALRFALERQTVLQRLSHRDDLTGLHNRRGFLIQADQFLRSARRHHTPVLLAVLDLDLLKQVNDRYGHAEGNRAIVETAEILRRCFRQSDLLARFGGDEFAALTQSSGEADEASVRGRLDAALTAVNIHPDRDYRLSFSMGLTTAGPRDDAPVEVLLERADHRMYQEKRRKADGLAGAGMMASTDRPRLHSG